MNNDKKEEKEENDNAYLNKPKIKNELNNDL